MNFFKVISGGVIIDVIQNATFVRKGANGMVLISDAKNAMGVASSDGKTVWQIKGFGSLGEGFKEVELVEISEETYKTLETQIYPDGREGDAEAVGDTEEAIPDVPGEFGEQSEPVKRRKTAKEMFSTLYALIDYMAMMSDVELPDLDEMEEG